MPAPAGRTLALSPPRRLVTDLMHASRRVPLVCMERRMRLAPVVAARRLADPRPGWCAIFTKAFGIVSARTPELRQSYLSFPRPRLYEHPEAVASVAVERLFGPDLGVGFCHIRRPEIWTLNQIHEEVARAKELPAEQVGSHRRALRVTALPLPVRRLLWWVALDVSGVLRVRHFGTYGVTAMAGSGSTSFSLLSPLTTTLYYGIFASDGSVDVRLAFDHRVFDGGVVAQALAGLEAVLLDEICAELSGLRAAAAA
jgi:hypothetical protein